MTRTTAATKSNTSDAASYAWRRFCEELLPENFRAEAEGNHLVELAFLAAFAAGSKHVLNTYHVVGGPAAMVMVEWSR